jgi:phosphoserine aminotransferase
MPKVFRMVKKGKFDAAIFEGETINTPSMLCVEDYLDALTWAESLGGQKGLVDRANANAKVLHDWIERTPWIANLANDKAAWSNTSVCLKIVDPAVTSLSADVQAALAKDIVSLLDKENAAKDIGSYRDAPAGLRIWTGSTVEKADVEALLPWLDWAFATAKAKLAKAA